MRPNGISISGVAIAFATGVALAISAERTPHVRALLLLAAAVGVQLRLLCNLLDGMLAVEGGLKSKTGDIFNEMPDRIADVFILVGAGYSIRHLPHGVTLGWAAALVAVFTAYVRQMGGALGVTQHFIGPMAKQHRMFTLTVACVIAAIEAMLTLAPRAMFAGLTLIIVGSVVTAVRRTRRIVSEMEAR